ncbi:sensor histidine kinase N-terminal domain-containing protein [Candidatus Sumerlaeota bacterium]|nr:sensor histidine kinase N-terminal domain-containing protein [Candidatus Sumerlaeota bacterium]
MNSIRIRLALALFTGILALFALSGVAFYRYMRREVMGQFDEGLNAKARAMASLVERGPDAGYEFDFSHQIMREFARDDKPEYFEILDHAGGVIKRSQSLAGKDLFNPDKLDEARRKTSLSFWNSALPDGRSGRCVRVKFHPRREESDEPADAISAENESVDRSQTLHLILGRDLAPVERALRGLLTGLIGAGTIFSFGAALIVLLAVKRGFRPLTALAAQTGGIDAESLGRRFQTRELPLELRPIARALNALLGRLENSFERERRFTGNVAHELRTPIAELRSMAEVGMKWPDDREATVQSFRDAAEIAAQMENIVSALLDLARVQENRQALSPEEIELGPLIDHLWGVYAGKAREKHLTVKTEIAGARLRTDRTLLTRMLDNLFSNAIEYTPAGGEIEFRLAGDKEHLEFSLANTTAALDATDMEHIFEPFWRKDAARSDRSRSGIGLALVAACAQRLGFELRAELPASGRFRMVLRLSGEEETTPPKLQQSPGGAPEASARLPILAQGTDC